MSLNLQVGSLNPQVTSSNPRIQIHEFKNHLINENSSKQP